jgi:hypothetical protein
MRTRKMAASAAVVMVAASVVTATSAQARIVRVSYLPERYQTYESCVDFTPTVRSDDAMVTDVEVYATRGFGVSAYYCPRGAAARAMRSSHGLKFKVRFTVFDARELEYLHGKYTTRVRLLD